MPEITLKGELTRTIGSLPEVNTKAPSLKLAKTDLSDVTRIIYAQQVTDTADEPGYKKALAAIS